MKYCKNCGTKLKSSDKFCTGCGKVIKENSDDISGLGKAWLIFISVLAFFGFLANIYMLDTEIIYLISALVCLIEVYASFKILRTKKKIYFYLLSAAFICNAVISLYNDSTVRSGAYLVGYATGILLDIGLTYLACYKHLED